MVYVAFLRGVNVAGHATVAMADLRAAVEALGFKSVRTLLQSGNLLFEAPAGSTAVERKLEAQIARQFRMAIPATIRTASDLARIVSSNPFVKEAEADPAHLLAVFLKGKPRAGKEQALRAAIAGRERIQVKGDVLYAVYPDGVGRSKLTTALIDQRLGTLGTARNWNTVLKLLNATASQN